MSTTPGAEKARTRVQSAIIPDDPRANLDEFQTAKLTGMSVFWLRRKRWSGGGIPYIKIADGTGGAVRYRREAVDAFISSRSRRSTSDRSTANAA